MKPVISLNKLILMISSGLLVACWVVSLKYKNNSLLIVVLLLQQMICNMS